MSGSAAIWDARRRRVLLGVLAALAVSFAAYCAYALFEPRPGDSRYDPVRKISLQEGPRAPGGALFDDGTGLLLRVAVAPVISPEKSLGLYKPFVDHLGRILGRKGILLQRQSYAEVNDLIRHGGCEIAFVCTYSFVRGERDFGMKVLAAPQIGGRVTYRSYLIVPSASRDGSLLDLRDKRFASGDLLSNSGWLYPATVLLKGGEDPERFFRQHVLTGSHDGSIRAVATSFVDGAAVDSLVYEQMVEEDPSLGSRTRIVLKSPEFGMPPVVAGPSLDPELRKSILDALLGMHEDPEGRETLAKLRIERFVVPDGATYDSVREAARVWETRR